MQARARAPQAAASSPILRLLWRPQHGQARSARATAGRPGQLVSCKGARMRAPDLLVRAIARGASVAPGHHRSAPSQDAQLPAVNSSLRVDLRAKSHLPSESMPQLLPLIEKGACGSGVGCTGIGYPSGDSGASVGCASVDSGSSVVGIRRGE